MSLLSVIVPCYNEEESVALFYQELTKNDPFFKEKEIELELLYIDDGSKDGTVREVKKLIEQDSRVHVVSFSRNFGKEAAIFAGLAQACGDVVAVMDCDLQHPPQTLLEMYRLWQEGYEVIEGVKADRGKEGFLHKECAGFFYDIMSKATKVNMKDASDFKMMDRKAVDSILSLSLIHISEPTRP